ncbi:hypothetical protein [Rhodococcoides corynebacterioides]|uniref:hypothetical protein n=1 Tax=Rhodococcoides corynebacterioides TaxID=53972 RepID=UPI003AE6631F
MTRVLPAARAGRTAWVVDAADVPHSFTDVLDEARALIAVVDDPSTWGRVWHAPTNPPVTLRRAIGDVLEAAGLPPVPVRVIPRVVTRAGGLVVPLMRELNALSYQRTRHYEMDSTRSQETLGLAPTPWEEVCRRTGL